jgi:hypothetical protein
MGQGYILREEGTRYNAENIQERGGLTGNTLHAAGWVTWDAKIPQLIFYHHKSEYTRQPPPPPKPRNSKYITPEQYEQDLKDWQAKLPPKEEVKPKGNAMTQEYYSKKILPHYIDAMNQDRLQDSSHSYYLMEDGDPSHGFRTQGKAQDLRDANWIINLEHPSLSPDLNPCEGVWNIEKQRIRKNVWNDNDELEALAQKIWQEIPQSEIRRRIAEMPWRCRRLVETGGQAIKSDLW